MKVITIILITLLSVSSVYSQKESSEVEKFSQKILQNISKGDIWVMDVMKSYTGQGSTEWEFDYTEVVLARNSKGLPTLIETQEKTEGTANWVNLYHAEISYFNNDSVSEYKLKEWNTQTNNWVSELSYYEQKDEEGKLLIQYSRSWGYDEYEDRYRFVSGNKEIYTYDANGFKTEKLDNDWNNDTWEDFFKTIYTYDASNNLILDYQYRFISTGNWRYSWKTEFKYNENNEKIKEQEYGYDSYYEKWYDYSVVTYTYYENGLIKNEFTQRFDIEATEWYNATESKYYYTTNGLLDYKEELDIEASSNNLKYDYTYDENDNEINFDLYLWNGDWSKFYQVFDYYDENGNQSSYYSQVTDESGVFINNLKEEYTWNQFTLVESMNKLSVTIFPNPVINNLNLISEEDVNIEVVNGAGQVVYKTLKDVSNFKLDISNYHSGIYFVKLSNLNGETTLKFLKK